MGALPKLTKTSLVYKITAILSVIILSSYGYGIFATGGAPHAVLYPVQVVVSPGKNVTFDASGSTGGPLVYTWQFHDGTPTQYGKNVRRVRHVFEKEGIYYVTLFVTARNAKMDMATAKVVVRDIPPVAVVNEDHRVAMEDMPVRFDASSSHDPDGEITRYLWDFGDGTTAQEPVVNHIYKSAGMYTVNLTVIDNYGKYGYKDISMEIRDVKPSVTVGNYTVKEGFPVYLEACGNDTPSDINTLRCLWDNGKHGKRTAEIYPDNGIYHPWVKVTDDNNLSSVGNATVVVKNTKPIAV